MGRGWGRAAGLTAPRRSGRDSTELLATFRTKSTTVQLTQFTYRNILLAAGAYSAPQMS